MNRHLVAQRMSQALYSTSVGQLSRFLAEQGMPTALAAIRRERVVAEDGAAEPSVGLAGLWTEWMRAATLESKARTLVHRTRLSWTPD